MMVFTGMLLIKGFTLLDAVKGLYNYEWKRKLATQNLKATLLRKDVYIAKWSSTRWFIIWVMC